MRARGSAGAATQMKIAERRNEVQRLYLGGYTQTQIAEELGVSQPTVCSDVAAIRAGYDFDRQAVLDRELMSLEAMERQTAQHYAETKDLAAIDTRLRVKKRKADLLGLDAAVRVRLEVGELTDDQLLSALTAGGGSEEAGTGAAVAALSSGE